MNLCKKMLALVLTGVMTLSLAACGTESGTSGTSSKPEAENTSAPAAKGEILGRTLKYDTSVPVNNGEDIEISLWTDPEVEPFYRDLAEKYHAVHENVTINVMAQPWSDYWKKLPLAMDAKRGPDLYRGHAGYINNTENYTYELPEDIFPRDQLNEDFSMVEGCEYNGKLYSVPLGMSTGAGVYYNKKMWAEAGLTEADIPKTWDEFEKVGRKLVKKDDKGNITQYGFSIDHAFEGFIDTMNYSSGQKMFRDDLFTYNLDSETTYKNLARIAKWKDDFMMYSDGDAEDEFGHEQVAMCGHWMWVGGYWNDEFPDVDWGFFLCPTEDGEPAVAYDQTMMEWTLCVSATDEAKRAVAFDILKYYLCEQNTYLDHCARLGMVCCNKALVNDAKFDALPNIKTIAEVSDKLVFLGINPMQEARNKAVRAAGSDIFINGKDPHEVIKATLDQLARDAEKNNVVFKSVEPEFEGYDKLHD